MCSYYTIHTNSPSIIPPVFSSTLFLSLSIYECVISLLPLRDCFNLSPSLYISQSYTRTHTDTCVYMYLHTYTHSRALDLKRRSLFQSPKPSACHCWWCAYIICISCQSSDGFCTYIYIITMCSSEQRYNIHPCVVGINKHCVRDNGKCAISLRLRNHLKYCLYYSYVKIRQISTATF